MAAKKLPLDVVTQDRVLETAHVKSQEELAAHRWHWTRDESNPDRVTYREYGRQVGLSESKIGAMVRGYVLWLDSADDIGRLDLTDHIELAKVGEEKRLAIKELAKATNRTASNVAANQRGEVSQVLDIAHERAERNKSTVEEEIPGVVAHAAKSRDAAKKRETARKQRHSHRYIEVEGHLAAAMRRLREAMETAKDVDFDDEELELLQDTMKHMRSLMDLIDLRFGGAVSVDWDAELAALSK